jgi:hypothetical protein
MHARLPSSRFPGITVVCVTAVVLAATLASFFLPVGPRAGLILDAPMVREATRVGMTRGVLCYRRESPPVLGGQQLAWEPTLTGDDPFGPWHRDVSWWRIVWNVRSRPVLVSEARVPAWPAAAVLLVWSWWLVRRWVVVARRRRRKECEWCGYPLGAGGTCGECGRSAWLAILWRAQREGSARRRLAAGEEEVDEGDEVVVVE